MSTVLKYPGSKWGIADWIISHMPPHVTYLEPYFGSGAVFFRKSKSAIETINDLDDDVVNLFRVIRDNPEELGEIVALTPWARSEYQASYERTGDPMEDARRFLVRMWQAFGTKSCYRTGWRNDVQGRGTSSIPRWQQLPAQFMAIAERLMQAQIECRPAVDLIRAYRHPDVLIYADPPYVRQTRASKMYRHEMTNDDHMELLEALNNHPGPVLLSGYSSELYDERLGHWERRTTKGRAELGQVKVEVLWLNQAAVRAQTQVMLPIAESSGGWAE